MNSNKHKVLGVVLINEDMAFATCLGAYSKIRGFVIFFHVYELIFHIPYKPLWYICNRILQ